RAGRVLEPEALGRVGVLGLLGQGLFIAFALLDPIARLLLDPLARLLRELGLELLLLALALALAQLRAQPVLLELALVLLVLRGGRLQQGAEIVVLGDAVLLLGLIRLGLILVVRLKDTVLVARARRRGGGRIRQRAAVIRIVGTEDVRGGQQLGRGRRGGASVAVGRGALGGRQQRRQRARERVDLVRREHRAVRQLRLVLGEQPLQP